MPKKPVANAAPRYNPFQQAKWFEYVEEGADEDAVPIRVQCRTNLTFGELEALTWDAEDVTSDRDLWPMFAPLVLAWNLSGVDAAGHEVEIPAPAVGGPEQFQYIPPQLFAALVRDIRLRSTGPLARRTSSKPGSTDDGPNESA